jgi:hypothetical protein
VEFCQLGEIHAIAWPIGGPLHRQQMGEGAHRSNSIRRDLDTYLIASQLDKALIDPAAPGEPQSRPARFDRQPNPGAWSQTAMDRDSRGAVPS